MDIHCFTSSFSTAYLLIEGGRAMLVDASMPDIAPRVLDTLGRVGAHLDLIVLTHFHYDHVGAAEALRAATGAKIAIHRLDADALRRGGKLELVGGRLRGRLMAPGINRTRRAGITPDIELADHEDLTGHGGFGRALHTPGHTPGSICILLDDGTAFAGDALSEHILRPHRAAGPLFIDDHDEAARSIEVIDRAAVTVYVAHLGELHRPSLQRLAHRLAHRH